MSFRTVFGLTVLAFTLVPTGRADILRLGSYGATSTVRPAPGYATAPADTLDTGPRTAAASPANSSWISFNAISSPGRGVGSVALSLLPQMDLVAGVNALAVDLQQGTGAGTGVDYSGSVNGASEPGSLALLSIALLSAATLIGLKSAKPKLVLSPATAGADGLPASNAPAPGCRPAPSPGTWPCRTAASVGPSQ